MSKTLTAGMIAHLAGTAHKRCRMLRLDLADGSVLAITDHDRDLTFDLGDGDVLYRSDTGMAMGDLQTSTGFDPDDFEVTGPVTDTGYTTLAALRGGRFDDAVARRFQVCWSDLTLGAIPELLGFVALVEIPGSQFKLTIHSEIAKFARIFGFVTSPYCRFKFGDPDTCGATPVEVVATVTAVTDALQFSVSHPGTAATDFFNRGAVAMLTGALAGTTPVEVTDYTSTGAGTATIELDFPLAAIPGVGDTMTLKQGCGHTRPDCVEIQGDAVNFGGEPDLPGLDRMVTYPNPGSSSA